MTHEEHRQRHVELHRAFDELLADYARHHPQQNKILETEIGVFLGWSHEQTIEPTEVDARKNVERDGGWWLPENHILYLTALEAGGLLGVLLAAKAAGLRAGLINKRGPKGEAVSVAMIDRLLESLQSAVAIADDSIALPDSAPQDRFAIEHKTPKQQ